MKFLLRVVVIALSSSSLQLPVILTDALSAPSSPQKKNKADVLTDGRVLAPKSNGAGWWDDECCANPIVIKPPFDNKNNKWKMFYYGRPNGTWKNGNKEDGGTLPAFLPSGLSGMAESDDGLQWERVEGPLEKGCVLQPSDDPNAFDSVQIGLTDVVIEDESEDRSSYIGFYFGANNEEIDFGGGNPARGFKMLPGIVTSRDKDGLHWERMLPNNPILDVGKTGEWDSNFCSWPRVVPTDPNNSDVREGEWLLTYHTLQPTPGGEPFGSGWAVGAAISKSGCIGPYTKIGKILEGGANVSWDCKGIGTRHVIHDDDGKLVMVYEGVGPDDIHRLGLASSEDGGRTWQKANNISDQPGGPIIEGRISDDNAWDNYNIGTPYVVPYENKWRLYYVGAKPGSFAIGCMESDELWSTNWKRVDGTC